MREEREITVRIFTERTGFDLPLGGLFGAVPMDFLPGADEEPDTDLPDEPDDEEPDDEGSSADEPTEEEPEGEPFPVEDTTLSKEEDAPEKSEFFATGKLVETDDRLEIVYEESVLTGMEGSLTTVGFSKSTPDVVTMVRQGFVNTALVFEQGKRHISVYQTPFSEFELCVSALSVQNLLLREGVIHLDYVTELHGARTERCKMDIIIG